MSAIARLAGFAGAVVAVAGAAAAVGLAVGPVGHDDGGSPHGDGGHGGMAVQDHAAPPGLAVTEGGLTLVPVTRTVPLGGTTEYAFRIVDEDGETVTDFDVEHERRMHMIVVRRDLTGFRHLHPVMDPDGTWRVRMEVGEPGVHRVFADFSRDGASATLGVDLTVPGAASARPLPAPAPETAAGPYRVRLDGDGDALTFRVERDGRPVTDLQPYLGARGHLVALREGDLAFLHVHPLDDATAGDAVSFRVEWPSAGRYRLFLQFRHRGRVVTAPFTREVTP